MRTWNDPVQTAAAHVVVVDDAFAVLIAFGRWQWEKYEIKSAAAEEPVAEMTIASYQPVEAGIQFVFAVRPDTHEQGWRVFTPARGRQRYLRR